MGTFSCFLADSLCIFHVEETKNPALAWVPPREDVAINERNTIPKDGTGASRGVEPRTTIGALRAFGRKSAAQFV
jgi:hypothetical protein